MSNGSKTDLQRRIVTTWYENPNATNKEIAEACDCSASYVSQVKNRFDDYNEMEYMFDSQNKELEQIFGGDVFEGSSGRMANGDQPTDGKGIGEMYEELPDNAAGNVMRAIILLVLLYALYEVGTILLF